MSNASALTIDPKIYQRIFQEDKDGAAILEELAAVFVYPDQFVPGQPDTTARNLGAKAVIMAIMERSADNI